MENIHFFSFFFYNKSDEDLQYIGRKFVNKTVLYESMDRAYSRHYNGKYFFFFLIFYQFYYFLLLFISFYYFLSVLLFFIFIIFYYYFFNFIFL